MKPSLVVLAAGIGSRYGGLKQLDSFGPSGEKIIDYSVFDAIRVGFDKVVFIIRKAFESDFKKYITNNFADKINVAFVYQELDNVPQGVNVPANREKPWGTAHAVLVAAQKVNEPFVVINADDFYGAEALRIPYNFLSKLHKNDDHNYCIVGYKLANTLSEHGSVARGVCEMDEQGYLKSLVERHKIGRKQAGIFYEENGDLIQVSEDVLVSMNLMGFTTSIFQHLESYVEEFIRLNSQDIKKEALLPTVVNEVIVSGKARMKILPTNSKWFGVTYKEDKKLVGQKIMELHRDGVYPEKLWE